MSGSAAVRRVRTYIRIASQIANSLLVFFCWIPNTITWITPLLLPFFVVSCCVVSCCVMSCRVVLCRVCVVSCHVVPCLCLCLCCVVLCYVVLCCVVLCCVVLCCVVLCCVVLCCVVLCCVVLCCVCVCVVLCCVVLCCVVLCCVVLCCVVLCCVVLCCVVLCCAVLCCAEGAVTRRQRPGCLPTGTGKRAGLCVLCARCVVVCWCIAGPVYTRTWPALLCRRLCAVTKGLIGPLHRACRAAPSLLSVWCCTAWCCALHCTVCALLHCSCGQRAAGSGTPATHCHTAWRLWAVELLLRTAALPGGSGHARGHWAVELLRYTASLPWGSGLCNSCNALPHCPGGSGQCSSC